MEVQSRNVKSLGQEKRKEVIVEGNTDIQKDSTKVKKYMCSKDDDYDDFCVYVR